MNESKYNQSKLIINLICSILALFLAVIYYLVRFGLDNNPISVVLNTLGISYFIIFSPYTFKKLISFTKTNIDNTFLNCDAFIQFANIFILVFCAFLFKFVPFPIYIPFVAVGFLGFGISIVDYFKIYKNKIFTLINVLLIAVFSLIIAHIIWDCDYAHPLFFEKILVGKPHIDSLLQITVANFLNTLKMITVGIDGAKSFSYHIGSHFIFSQLAFFIKTSLIVFYQIAFAVIFFPLFLSALFGMAVDFKFLKYENSDLVLKWWHYSFLVLAVLGTLPILSINGFRVDYLVGMLLKYNPIPLSESYLTSLTFFYLLISITLFAISKYKNQKLSPNSINLYLFLVVPILLLTIGICKIFTLGLIIPVIFYSIIRYKLFNKKCLAFLILAIVPVLTFMYIISTNAAYIASKFELFSFFKYTILPIYGPNIIWLPLMFVLYTLALNFWTILFSWTRFQQEKPSSMKELIKSKKLIDVEILVLIALLGFIPPELNIASLGAVGGNGYYLNTIQFWLAIPLFIGAFNIDINDALFTPPKKNKTIIALMFLTILIICANTISIFPDAKNGLNYCLELRNSIKETKKQPDLRYKAILELDKVNKTLSLKEKSSTALFIPKSNKAIWNSFEEDTRKIPFVITAVSGLPLIKGLKKDIVETNCKKHPEFCAYDKERGTIFSFYGCYPYTPTNYEPDYHDKTQFCNEVKEYIFSKYIVFDEVNGEIKTTKISCKY